MIPVTSDIIQLTGAVNSMQGGRPENQDDFGFWDTPLGFLLVVCDGMGGGPGGKTASGLVLEAVARAFQNSNAEALPEDTMKRAVADAEDVLEQRMDAVPELRGMGSTMVALLISKQSATIAHLGDSRCYRVSNRRVVFRTNDHSLVGELVQHKALTEEQARTSPQSNVITRGLGSTSNHVAEIETQPYQKGDRFILCTDGVWGIMPHDELVQRFTALQDVDQAVDNLSHEIDDRGFAEGGRHDNHTLAMVEMATDSIIKDKMNMKTKTLITLLAACLAVSLLFNVVHLLSGSATNVRKYLPSSAANEPVSATNEAPSATQERLSESDFESLESYNKYLEGENDRLKRENKTLRDQNDALTAQQKNESDDAPLVPETVQPAPQQGDDESSVKTQDNKPAVPNTSVDLAKKIVDNLTKIKNYKTKTSAQDAVKGMDKLRKDAIAQMKALQEAEPKLKNRIQKVINAISYNTTAKTESICMKVDGTPHDGFYEATLAAKQAMEKVIADFEENIQNKINPQ